jgi:Zn-dependent protease
MAKIIWLFAQLMPYSLVGEAILVPLNSTLIASVWINLVLCIFNFLPIPPLDGSRIVAGLLPPELARSYASFEKYGFILVILLAVTGVLSKLIIPLIKFANNLLLS